MTEFSIELKTELKVTFLDPEKAYNYFIKSDWRGGFFDFKGLNEVSEHLALQFDMWSNCEIEGFGEFVLKTGTTKWFCFDRGFDTIIIELVSAPYIDIIKEN